MLTVAESVWDGMDLHNPDETITAATLESLAVDLLGELPIRGVEGRNE